LAGGGAGPTAVGALAVVLVLRPHGLFGGAAKVVTR
jgi:hypothetical protein